VGERPIRSIGRSRTTKPNGSGVAGIVVATDVFDVIEAVGGERHAVGTVAAGSRDLPPCERAARIVTTIERQSAADNPEGHDLERRPVAYRALTERIDTADAVN
jgi:hypothetical protein